MQLSDTDVAQGLEQLKAALTQYDEEKFTAIRTWAREHLDWRSRLDQIAADAALKGAGTKAPAGTEGGDVEPGK